NVTGVQTCALPICALENPVVGFVLAHDAHRLPWMNENREVADCRSPLSHPGRGSAELASQNTTDLIEDWTSTTAGPHRPCRRNSTRRCRCWCRQQSAARYRPRRNSWTARTT